MLLAQVGVYNDLSPELRKKLQDKVEEYPNGIRFKFHISSINPDPTKYNGEYLWPNIYTLDPAIFTIRDEFEKREGKQKVKQIALIAGLDDKTGIANRFHKVKVEGRSRGIYNLDTANNPELIEWAMYLFLHPKLKDGMFQDKNRVPVIELIDEEKEAREERRTRRDKKEAMDKAYSMSDYQVKEFAAAMNWDTTEENEMLRNKIEIMAETDPTMFNDFVKSGKLKYQAGIKKAINKGILKLDPSECKLSWANTNQPIIALGISQDGKTDLERLAAWFESAGDKADAAWKKIESLNKSEKEVSQV